VPIEHDVAEETMTALVVVGSQWGDEGKGKNTFNCKTTFDSQHHTHSKERFKKACPVRRRAFGERSVRAVRKHVKGSRAQLASFFILSSNFLDRIPNP
jgi:hypothetical protein